MFPRYLILMLLFASGRLLGAGHVDGELIVLNPNGGWCWFQDPRAIVDNGRLIAGSVKSPEGDIDVNILDLRTRQAQVITIHPAFQSDDHNVPAFLRLSDGRYLVCYAAHGGRKDSAMMHARISVASGDPTRWGEDRPVDCGASVSYANLHMLSAEENRIYNFHRGIGFNPNYLLSVDGGQSFQYGGRLLNAPRPDPAKDPKATRLGGSGRPYLRYASNGLDTIHFVATEDHPRNYDNSIYHAFIRAGELHRSDGSAVGPLSRTRETAISPIDLTLVYRGDADSVAWTTDIELDRQGRPYIVFSVQKGSGAVREDGSAGGEDLRYFYGRWDGTRWNVHEAAHAGHRLYSPEVDYSGLAALDPHDPDVLYISTSADPASGKPLISEADGQRHYEIFRGRTSDGGRTWAWTAITRDSDVDNLRPIVPSWESDQTALLWLRGKLNTYTSYRLQVVAMLRRR